MKFYKNLYIGDTVKNPGKIKRKLKKNAMLPNIYIIAYMKELNRLEIYPGLMMQQYYFKEHAPYVIGLAGGQDEAAQMIGRIAEDALRTTGRADLIGYLMSEKSGKR